MRTPASVIKKSINRWFPFRGQATFCLTKEEFEHRWNRVVADCPYPPEILNVYKEKLMARWARIDSLDIAPRRVCRPTAMVSSERVKHNPKRESVRLEDNYPTREPLNLSWKRAARGS